MKEKEKGFRFLICEDCYFFTQFGFQFDFGNCAVWKIEVCYFDYCSSSWPTQHKFSDCSALCRHLHKQNVNGLEKNFCDIERGISKQQVTNCNSFRPLAIEV